MYSKKYRIDKIEELNAHNPIYDEIEGSICYLAYLNVGDRGWFLYENDWFGKAHRIHTSVIKDVKYTDNKVFVETQNTKFTFSVINK